MTLVCSSSLCNLVCLFFHVTMFVHSDCQFNFDPMKIQSMVLLSSTVQIRRHGYSEHLNTFIFVDLCTLSFYAINMDVVGLFANLSYLF